MGKIVNAMALSHAFAMRDPSTWDEGRQQNRSRYIERQGKEPPVPPGLAAANPADDAIRFEHIRSAQEKLRKELAQSKPDIVIVVGDDQNENLGKDLMPQIAVYTGGDYIAKMRHSRAGRSYRAEQAFSLKLLEAGVKRGFDIASIGSFADNTLMSHAHVQALDTLFPKIRRPRLSSSSTPSTIPRRSLRAVSRSVNSWRMSFVIFRTTPASRSAALAECPISPRAIPGRPTRVRSPMAGSAKTSTGN